MRCLLLCILLPLVSCQSVSSKQELDALNKKKVLDAAMHCLVHVTVLDPAHSRVKMNRRDAVMKELFTDNRRFVEFAQRLYVRSGRKVVMRRICPSDRRVHVLTNEVYYFVLDIGPRRVYGTYIVGQKQPFRLFEIRRFEKK